MYRPAGVCSPSLPWIFHKSFEDVRYRALPQSPFLQGETSPPDTHKKTANGSKKTCQCLLAELLWCVRSCGGKANWTIGRVESRRNTAHWRWDPHVEELSCQYFCLRLSSSIKLKLTANLLQSLNMFCTAAAA